MNPSASALLKEITSECSQTKSDRSSRYSRELTAAPCANIFAVGEKIRSRSAHKGLTHLHALTPSNTMQNAVNANVTRRERQILEILFRHRRASVEAIRAELPDPPSPSSVRKLLDIMIDRRLVAREYDGPRYVYFPAAAPEEASRTALRQLVRTFFDGSPGSAVAALLDLEGPLPDDEYRRLAALLKRSKPSRQEEDR